MPNKTRGDTMGWGGGGGCGHIYIYAYTHIYHNSSDVSSNAKNNLSKNQSLNKRKNRCSRASGQVMAALGTGNRVTDKRLQRIEALAMKFYPYDYYY